MTPKQLISPFQDTFDQLKNETRELYLKNAITLCAKVSELLSAYGKELKQTSGWRPMSYNAQIGGSPKSHHCSCQAVDLSDPDEAFGQWCTSNVGRLRELGLYMESLTTTHASSNPKKRWVHLQSVAPRSGSVIFKP